MRMQIASTVVEIEVAECQRHGEKKEEEGSENEIQFLHEQEFQWGKYSKRLLITKQVAIRFLKF